MSKCSGHHQQAQYDLPFRSPIFSHQALRPKEPMPLFVAELCNFTMQANQGQYGAENRHDTAKICLMGVGPAICNTGLSHNGDSKF